MCSSDTCDIFEALALHPSVHGGSTPNSKNADREDMNPDLYNDDETVLESDQIFRFSGIAPAGVEAEAREWCASTGEASRLCILPKYNEICEPRSRFQVPDLKVEARHKTIRFKRRKAHLLKGVSNIISLPQNIFPRWNLGCFTVTISDVLSGKTFKRQRDIANPESKSQREVFKVEKSQSFSTGNDTTIGNALTTPIMDQNNHPPSMGGHASPRNESHLILTPPATPKRQDTSTKGDKNSNVKLPTFPTDEMVFENLSFPSPPHRGGGCLTPPRSPPLLRGRPERTPAVSRPPRATNNAHPQLSIPTISSPTSSVTLSSTPYSLTSPQFRHGPIRVDRRQKCLSPEDKKLDWASFQMAILGVMDGREDEEVEVDCRIGEAELNDITQWFSGFGLGMGSIEKEAGWADQGVYTV